MLSEFSCWFKDDIPQLVYFVLYHLSLLSVFVFLLLLKRAIKNLMKESGMDLSSNHYFTKINHFLIFIGLNLVTTIIFCCGEFINIGDSPIIYFLFYMFNEILELVINILVVLFYCLNQEDIQRIEICLCWKKETKENEQEKKKIALITQNEVECK